MSFSIHTQTVGEAGGVVVFLPGLFGQGRNFSQIAKGLEPEFSSVLVDLPNHGASDWTSSFSYPEMADLVAEHLRTTVAADGPVHLVGHSMGGKVAMVLTLRHPELVQRLVVADISPTQRADMGEFEHLLDALLGLDLEQLSSRGEADEQLQGPIPEDMVRGFLLQSLVRSGDEFLWRPNLRLLRDSLPEIGDFPDISEEAAVEIPVLWIAGADSDYITEADAPAMRRLFPRARLIRIKDAGHWVHSEQPQVFTSVLKTFLSS
ncbi:alpha/beta fold hydrolase [Nesterenkonia alkaliphila]|uniref:Alpha/beta fold hydrolase n=1 Tax=Nesterenkonia alkaliphila TaxID=1463631 RepID=A0A7K1UEG7_9MICC|nr:alpha/beta fold hydrolase [Nesterenkonia alkaliphila]MVT24875.1 alpha/beta fold hydrolase [Nesterenkonia alkaliphila]GFZ92637.1 alpha/beta hydrolase [Nesterenkonia alkaliphila]